MVLTTDFDDGADEYNIRGRYAVIYGSRKYGEEVYVKLVDVDGGKVSTKKITLEKDDVRIVSDDEFYEATGIEKP